MDVYRGVEITNTYFAGHKNIILPTLKQSISGIIRDDRYIESAYIGVASGEDYYSALKNRIDERKLEHGVTRMYLLYMSSSENYTRSLEDSLIEYFRKYLHDDRFWNDRKGRGGRHGSGPVFCLYLAVRKLGQM